MTFTVMAALLLGAVFKFLIGVVESRCLVVLATDHTILIDLKDFSNKTTEIVVLCMQMSGLPSKLHQISLRTKKAFQASWRLKKENVCA